MAKQSGAKFVLVMGFSVIGSGILLTIQNKQPKTDKTYKYDGQTIVGKKIELEEGTPAYNNYKDAMIKIHKKTMYFDQNYMNNYEMQTGEKLERIVITAWYECGTKIETVNLDEQEKEKQIIQNGGELLAVETTIDKINHTPEAYYNAENIKKQKTINLKI